MQTISLPKNMNFVLNLLYRLPMKLYHATSNPGVSLLLLCNTDDIFHS